MTPSFPRLRMFAGPNGSGKSTVKDALDPQWLGFFVNADDIEKAIREHSNSFDLSKFGIVVTQGELLEFFEHSTLLNSQGLLDSLSELRLPEGILTFGATDVNSYHALAEITEGKGIVLKVDAVPS